MRRDTKASKGDRKKANNQEEIIAKLNKIKNHRTAHEGTDESLRLSQKTGRKVSATGTK